MKPILPSIELMTNQEMKLIHEKSLELLESPGISIDHEGFLKALEAKGAKIDYSKRVAAIPCDITHQAALAMTGKACLLNSDERAASEAVKAEIDEILSKPVSFGFGGASIQVLNEDGRTSRNALYADVERVVRFGNGHHRITSVGNPLLCSYDETGREIPPKLRPKYTMTYMAKHCTKLSSNEVWNARDVDFAVRLGELILGGPEAYRKNPIFLCVKCSISPFRIDAQSAETLYELAARQLPVGLVPMPISGASAPVTVASGILIANTEILGLAAAIWAVGSESAQAHGILGSILDMQTTIASFSSPNAVLMDAGLFQLYRHFYGRNVMAATDYMDAKYPGYQSGSERALKTALLASCGSFMPGIGQLKSGIICSPEQACLDIELFDWMQHYMRGIEVSYESLCVDLIRERGIGGNFLDTDHTFEHYRDEFYMPKLADRCGSVGLDMIDAAREEVERILGVTPVFTRDLEICEAVDRAFEEAL